MPETALVTKLKLKAGQRAVVLSAPDGCFQGDCYAHEKNEHEATAH
jgi:hypothetical protein